MKETNVKPLVFASILVLSTSFFLVWRAEAGRIILQLAMPGLALAFPASSQTSKPGIRSFSVFVAFFLVPTAIFFQFPAVLACFIPMLLEIWLGSLASSPLPSKDSARLLCNEAHKAGPYPKTVSTCQWLPPCTWPARLSPSAQYQDHCAGTRLDFWFDCEFFGNFDGFCDPLSSEPPSSPSPDSP